VGAGGPRHSPARPRPRSSYPPRPRRRARRAARRRRRAQFLRELHEAKQLRDRVQPRRARAARMRQQMRMRTFRW
ncbi:hypothetical protein, partial [Streptomyces griseus]